LNMEMEPLISIIMLAKNELYHLERSIPIILRQKIGYPFELIVIDSGSKDGSIEYVEKIVKENENVFLYQINPGEFHHAKTRNDGVDKARGKYVAFLGGDAIPKDNVWLKNLVQILIDGEVEEIAASFGKQIAKENADINNVIRMSFNYGDIPLIKHKEYSLSTKELYFFSSVTCCINRKLISPPLFDERIPVDEDVTCSYRIINNGFKIAYCPESTVVHSHNYSNWEIFRRYFDNAVVYSKQGIFIKGDSSVNNEGKKYLLHSFKILKEKPFKDWIKFFSFLSVSALGVKLGQNYGMLPKSISKKLSKYNTVEWG